MGTARDTLLEKGIFFIQQRYDDLPSQTSGTVKSERYLGTARNTLFEMGIFFIQQVQSRISAYFGYTARDTLLEMGIFYTHNATLANPDSSLKPDLRYSQGYLIPWIQLGIHRLKWEIIYPTALPWLTQTAHSSQTSGTVKDI